MHEFQDSQDSRVMTLLRNDTLHTLLHTLCSPTIPHSLFGDERQPPVIPLPPPPVDLWSPRNPARQVKSKRRGSISVPNHSSLQELLPGPSLAGYLSTVERFLLEVSMEIEKRALDQEDFWPDKITEIGATGSRTSALLDATNGGWGFLHQRLTYPATSKRWSTERSKKLPQQKECTCHHQGQTF